MKDIIDIRMACCVINKKMLLKHIEDITHHDKLRLLSDNTESMKAQIQKVIEKNNCHIVDIEDRGDVSHITITKNREGNEQERQD